MTREINQLQHDIRGCRLCAERFAATATQHGPKPVLWFSASARIVIAGQAPGAKVHASGKPFTDPSGDRLRDWTGLRGEEFYDREKVAIVPMAFCFPGYDAKGSDLPPPPICRKTWHEKVMAQFEAPRLTILVGGYAQKWHLKTKQNVTETVEDWRALGPRVFPLPHPSWRNTAWLKKNPWFEQDLVPALQRQVKDALDD
ncbi:MAG: uracil-DNA glycosylase family protein [Marinosulfonomonas sp.]